MIIFYHISFEKIFLVLVVVLILTVRFCPSKSYIRLCNSSSRSFDCSTIRTWNCSYCFRFSSTFSFPLNLSISSYFSLIKSCCYYFSIKFIEIYLSFSIIYLFKLNIASSNLLFLLINTDSIDIRSYNNKPFLYSIPHFLYKISQVVSLNPQYHWCVIVKFELISP